MAVRQATGDVHARELKFASLACLLNPRKVWQPKETPIIHEAGIFYRDSCHRYSRHTHLILFVFLLSILLCASTFVFFRLSPCCYYCCLTAERTNDFRRARTRGGMTLEKIVEWRSLGTRLAVASALETDLAHHVGRDPIGLLLRPRVRRIGRGGRGGWGE